VVKLTRRNFLTTVASGSVLVWAGSGRGQTAPAQPDVTGGASLLHDAATWRKFRAEIARRPDAKARLAREADEWLTGDVISIVHKKNPAPSGDPHDYISLSPYRWPDPKKRDGLPWITRDGEVNPEFYNYDNPTLERLCHAVPKLVLQAHATNSATHAQRAGRLLRAWFIDPATRMNPHLNYAQTAPGLATGTPGGIIDTTSLVFLADAASRLAPNVEWTPSHLAGVKDWFARYTDWLLTSEPGRKEGAAMNNHGSWYDAQVACFALFCDQPKLARQQIERMTHERIARQIEPDGRQPAELRRTLALTYSTYNLLAHACTARAAATLGIDLWNWKSADGRSLRAGLDWLVPYYLKQHEWTHPQIRPFDFTSAAVLLNLAAQSTGDATFVRASEAVEEQPWQRLLFSKSSLAARQPPRPL
jgi:hypothetical protein